MDFVQVNTEHFFFCKTLNVDKSVRLMARQGYNSPRVRADALANQINANNCTIILGAYMSFMVSKLTIVLEFDSVSVSFLVVRMSKNLNFSDYLYACLIFWLSVIACGEIFAYLLQAISVNTRTVDFSLIQSSCSPVTVSLVKLIN